jgi:hypothetical protein
MNDQDTIELAAKVLHAIRTNASSSEIAEYARSSAFAGRRLDRRFQDIGALDPFTLSAMLTRSINRHIKSTAQGRRIINGTPRSGWTLGPYAERLLAQAHEDLQRPRDNSFTGLAGEYAVMGELSACDWNVSKLAHDDGVDIVAIKGGEFRTVQVKTAHQQPNGTYVFTVNPASHRQHEHLRHYYVLVMRAMQPDRYINEFLILNHRDMQDLQGAGAVMLDGEKGRITVKTREGAVMVGDTDLRARLNRFRQLFQ